MFRTWVEAVPKAPAPPNLEAVVQGADAVIAKAMRNTLPPCFDRALPKNSIDVVLTIEPTGRGRADKFALPKMHAWIRDKAQGLRFGVAPKSTPATMRARFRFDDRPGPSSRRLRPGRGSCPS